MLRKNTMNKRTLLVAAAVVGTSVLAGRQLTSAQPALPPLPASGESVKSIELPQIATELPEAKGKNLVVANCIICHSHRYILMQPNFPRKTWEAEVDKMRKVFGAPVPEAAAPEIVDYLMAIRGK